MTKLSLHQANAIIDATFSAAKDNGFKPMTVAILDAGGHLVALQRSDGSSNLRPDVAIGKANGCLAVGMGGGWLQQNAIDRPHFINGLIGATGGKLIPVRGGVLIRYEGEVIGAVGVTGDTSENDELCAVTGIEAVGLTPQAD